MNLEPTPIGSPGADPAGPVKVFLGQPVAPRTWTWGQAYGLGNVTGGLAGLLLCVSVGCAYEQVYAARLLRQQQEAMRAQAQAQASQHRAELEAERLRAKSPEPEEKAKKPDPARPPATGYVPPAGK